MKILTRFVMYGWFLGWFEDELESVDCVCNFPNSTSIRPATGWKQKVFYGYRFCLAQLNYFC